MGLEGGSDRLLVVDYEPEVPSIVRRLAPSLAERDELVAHVDERHPRLAIDAAHLEDRAVERQRRLEVADLERNVIDAHEAGTALRVIVASLIHRFTMAPRRHKVKSRKNRD